MAKGNQKSNREIRKPKTDKHKPTQATGLFEKSQGLGMTKKGAGHKQLR